MKLLSFRINGKDTYGVLKGDKVIDVGAALSDRYSSLRVAIENNLNGVEAAANATGAPSYSQEEITFLPVIPDTHKFMCIGRNYLAHIEERKQETPEFPRIFPKFPSSLVGHNQAMVRPKASNQYDYEGEFCIIIGKGGRHIKREDAMSHVIGYTILCDGTMRDFQKHSLMIGKNFQKASSCGPWMVTADEIKDLNPLVLETRLNGKVMQHSIVGDLLFDFPYLISYASQAFELMPGDLITAGTPNGVGAARTPPVWMQPGDVLEIEVEGIGTLRNNIIGE